MTTVFERAAEAVAPLDAPAMAEAVARQELSLGEVTGTIHPAPSGP